MDKSRLYRITPRLLWVGGSAIFCALTVSCIPVAIGAAGLAVGYIARDEGFGQAPALSGGGNSSYTDYIEEAPTETQAETYDYDSPAAYGGDTGDAPDFSGEGPVY